MFYKKKKSNWPLLIILFILILFSGRNLLFPEKIISDISFFSIDLLSKPFNIFKHQQTDDKLWELRFQELEEELNKIEEAFAFDSELFNYHNIYATVLSRNVNVWHQNLIVNKGEQAGVKVGDPVITNGVLIGVVEKTSFYHSRIKLLTSDNFDAKISVKVLNNEEDYGVLISYQQRENYFIIEGFSEDIIIEENHLVLTTGLTDNFPFGLVVGEVIDIAKDDFGLSNLVKVKPKIDFNKIHYVVILGEQK